MGFINALSGLGRLLVAGALACAALALVVSGEARMVLLTIALSIGITGLTFSILGRRLGRVSGLDKGLLAVGVAGTATVTSVRDTGVMVNGGPVIEFGLDVDSPLHAGYSTTIRQRVPRLLAGNFSPGAVVGVRVDPTIADHLAIDWNMAPREQPSAPPTSTRLGGFREIDELLREGRHATAIITSMEDAGDMSELGLVEVGADGEDDRMFIIGLEVKQAGMSPYEVRVGHRVPERLLGRVGPRTTVEVAVDRDDDHAVAIDWSSVGH